MKHWIGPVEADSVCRPCYHGTQLSKEDLELGTDGRVSSRSQDQRPRIHDRKSVIISASEGRENSRISQTLALAFSLLELAYRGSRQLVSSRTRALLRRSFAIPEVV